MNGPRLLLVEPHAVMRSAVTAVAKEVYQADHGLEVQPLSSAARAVEVLAREHFELLFVALDDAGQAIALLEQVRAGSTKADASTPVVVSAAACDARLLAQLKALQVVRVLLTPYKVKSVVEAIGQAIGRHQSLTARDLA